MGRVTPLLLAIHVLGSGCDGRAVDQQRVRRTERALWSIPLTYADRQPESPANPTGVYWEGATLWVWSDSHRLQRSYRRTEGRFRPGRRRRGPAGTTRCVVGRALFVGSTLCVGRYHPGGLASFGRETLWSLPQRAGFVDLVVLHELGLVGVLDAVADRLIWLDHKGAVVGGFQVPPSSYRIGPAGGRRFFVLSGIDPKLTLARVRPGGATERLASWSRAAPVRDALYDQAHDLLWLAGPQNRAVRRHRGPVEHLASVLTAFDGAALQQGKMVPSVRLDLQAQGLADPTRLASVGGRVVATLAGSDALAWVTKRGDTWQLEAQPSGLSPAGLAYASGLLAVAARLEDAIYLHDTKRPGKPVGVIALDKRPRTSLRDIGERLFYGTLLWNQSGQRPFTCNSCHWDGESDHRIHPGLLESRYEQTRPVAGVGALRPVFTPGQSSGLAEAVDGFIRILDDRYWQDRKFEERPIAVPLKGGSRRNLSPTDKRRALMHFLAKAPVSPGPYLRTRVPEHRALIDAGRRLFIEDCADCHAPRPNLHGAGLVAPADLTAMRERQPLVFGAAGFARSGAGPHFTDRGNRISPLLGLGRGGPYFSSGSAPTLQHVLRGFTRRRPGVHAASPTEATYNAGQLEQLEAFLHTL